MSNPKVVFEPVLGRWRVESRTRQSDEWQTEVYASTLEEAREVAQEKTNHDLDGAYRVVDTQPDAEDEHAPIVVHSCADHAHVFVPHNPRLYDHVPGEGLFIRERSSPERWRVDVTAPVKRWVPHALFNSRESAEAYAEALVKRSAQRNLMARVVDTNPSDPVTVAIFEEDNV